ncbi:2-oxo acid dehydrogenase subunit E2 [Nonomuraea gerenzanensis]|uniref:Dihydrolipoamide acetyltransferase component of pyruvate dehydrogenase complex n=1 Tax=Nonomuraea gerenzanensis TaxID=93944 RepID=A0A1M4DYN0_9ACTN|nr:2-oxo acid dehydrogenase subunit E2 [Nonomuraea gerenzanensis]UBU14004.1 2-oxo acid dehydrogenase subunit E2 [Nonomuraea gerenzanensis]SBO91688.1 Dihydrolipoamide acyltransferase component of branched-chain alpha-keto acid dehydrogenase complex [Nonomuraea gerenzanensis]
MSDIVVPKLNDNDSSYTLACWLVPPGSEVAAGDPIAEIETSKATQELLSPGDGVLHQSVAAGGECCCGDVIGQVLAAAVSPPVTPVPAPRQLAVITEPARALALELGIPEADLLCLDKPLIQRRDVEALAADQPVHRFSRNQQAVASVVALSHRDIPAAFAAITVRVGDALSTAHRLSRVSKRHIGLPELVIKAIAGLRTAHPLCFATRLDERTATLPTTSDVGVTLDLGQGLYIPVITDAEALTCADIARALTRHKAKAMDGSFTEADLRHPNILLSLHNVPDIVLAGPIVLPGTTCALTLAGTRQELTLTSTGQVRARKVATISIVYDHRTVTGRAAMALLTDLKTVLESPAALAGEPAPEVQRP